MTGSSWISRRAAAGRPAFRSPRALITGRVSGSPSRREASHRRRAGRLRRSGRSDVAVEPATAHPEPGPVLLRPRVRLRVAASKGAGCRPRPVARCRRRVAGVAAGRAGAVAVLAPPGSERDSPRGSTARPTSRSPRWRHTARCSAGSSACCCPGNPNVSLGATALTRLLGAAESMPVDLGRLEERADQERDRLRTRLDEACERLAPGMTPSRLVTYSSGTTLVRRESTPPPGRRSRRRRPSSATTTCCRLSAAPARSAGLRRPGDGPRRTT